MSAPLDPAEVERVRGERAVAYEEQEDIMERLRRHEINMSQCKDLSNAIVWPRWSRSSIGPCMPGCAERHDQDGFEDTVYHRVTVGKVPSTRDGGTASVEWGFVDDLAKGTRSAAEIVGSGADDGVGPDAARKLAGLLVQAAAQVEHWDLQQLGGEPR